MAPIGKSARSTWFDRANLVLAGAAGASLIFMVVVIAAGVMLRYGFARPILGSNEIVQLTAVAVVMLALPLCTAANAHVRVDVLDSAIGPWGRLLGDLLSRSLSSFALAILSWRAVFKALDAYRYGDATNMLGLPIWPFYTLVAAGMALCVTILLVQIVAMLAGTHGHE